MTEKPAAEEYVYHIGKIRFIVTPVYKETGELMRDILLKLMLADLEPVYPIDILNMGGQARYNIVRMNDLLLDCQRGGLYETVKQKTRIRHSRSLLPTEP